MRIKPDNVQVAPLAGARIEILKGVDYYPECDVAPLAGARIEINVEKAEYLRLRSLPSRERGLKSKRLFICRLSRRSLPSRERGLKLFIAVGFHDVILSLPSRERGLK